MRPESSTDPSRIPFETSHHKTRRLRPNCHRRGRPRVLDDAKRREVCAFVAGGCELRDAARYVKCSVNTIRREAERNPDFDEQLRQSEAHARLSPLRAMQQAARTHWRAAAWLLERTFPEQFGRRSPGIFGGREARELMKEVLRIIRDEIFDPFKADDVERRIQAAFEYHIRMACDEVRDSRSLRAAMKFFEDKNRISGPLADLGVPTPERVYNLMRSSRTSPPAQPSAPNQGTRQPAAEHNEQTVAEEGAMRTGLRGHATVQGRRRSPDPAAKPTPGFSTNSRPTTPKPQHSSTQAEPIQPADQPCSQPDRSLDPKTLAKVAHLRNAVQRASVSPRPLAKFIRNLTKELQRQAPASSTFDPPNPKSH